MNVEHEVVIEAMLKAFVGSAYANGEPMHVAMKGALRAAAERGWVLAKMPEKAYDDESGHGGWNACLDAIEAINLEAENDT